MNADEQRITEIEMRFRESDPDLARLLAAPGRGDPFRRRRAAQLLTDLLTVAVFGLSLLTGALPVMTLAAVLTATALYLHIRWPAQPR
ncbi:DUF3040 domain-containing protein [Amycolatopsis sp. NPDC006131]|uniref:DUF3040 domain-containing protein n=1 Tax=Amycolatopsis sp. NPDC006131 TaxID=3156731 RepID=UPI0033ACF45A